MCILLPSLTCIRKHLLTDMCISKLIIFCIWVFYLGFNKCNMMTYCTYEWTQWYWNRVWFLCCGGVQTMEKEMSADCTERFKDGHELLSFVWWISCSSFRLYSSSPRLRLSTKIILHMSIPVLSFFMLMIFIKKKDLCICFIYCCLSLCPFSFGHCVVCPFSFGHCVVCPFSFGHCVVCSSIYVFW